MSRLTVTETDHVVQITLNRADKKNAMDDAMIDALIEAGQSLVGSDARAVILHGAGDCFCAGIDISGLTKLIGADLQAMVLPRTHGDGTTNRWQEVAMVWHRLEIPVIAALHGAVYGAGLQLALGADIRIASPDAKLAVMEMKWGIIPDMGGMVLLPRLVRDDVMKRMIYSAKPISAEQAERWGLVTEIAEDPLSVAQEIATDITFKGPNAIRAAKKLCHMAYEKSAADMLMAEAETQVQLLGKPEQMEVIAAQFGKRKPNFK